MTAAGLAVVAVCGLLLVDDELSARAARAELEDEWLPARAASRDLVDVERDAVDALAGYQAAPSPRASASAVTAVRQLRDSAAQLRLPAGDPELASLEQASRTAVDTWLAQRATPLLAHRPAPAGAADAQTAMRRAAGLVERALDQRAARAQASMDRTKALLRGTVLVESLLLIVLLTMLMLGIRTRVLHPLVRLRRDLDRSAGQLAHVITPQGPAEIAAVARDAEHMRRSLIREHDRSDQATTALRQAAPLAVAVRAELDRHDADVPGVVGFNRPVEGVIAGDWWWAGQRADGARVLAVADVSGHGVAAGMLALESRTLVTSALQAGVALSDVSERLAQRAFQPGMFLSLFMCVLRDDAVDYCSAGHPHAVVLDAHGSSTSLPPTGPVISALGGRWPSVTVALPTRGALVAATDGLLEAAPDADFPQLASRAWQRARGSAAECLEQLLGQARERSGAWSDDVTVVIAS